MMEKGLTKENTLPIRGIAALGVVLFHLSGKLAFVMNNSILYYAVYQLYFIPVIIFFFLSGYGLTQSFKKKGFSYVKSLPSKRILRSYVSYLFFCMVTIGIKLCTRGGGKLGISVQIFAVWRNHSSIWVVFADTNSIVYCVLCCVPVL